MSLENATGPAFQSLAGQLSLVMDRPVINRTGLSGRFDVHLRWNANWQDPQATHNEDEWLIDGLLIKTGRPSVRRFRSNLA